VKILYITYGLPQPPTSGARIRDFNLISRVARDHQVSILSLLEFDDERDHIPELKKFCEHVDGVVADRKLTGTAIAVVTALLQGRPLATVPYYYPELARKIKRLTMLQHFDLIQIEHSFLAPYHQAIASNCKASTVLSLHNIAAQQYKSMLDMSSGPARIPAALKCHLMQGWESRYANQFDHLVTVSDQDKDRLQALGVTGEITSIDNGVDCEKMLPLAQPPEGTTEIIFIATMGYMPNADAMRFFCREIFPLVRAQRPDCRLNIVGSGGSRHLSDLAQTGIVELTDRIEDPIPYYERSSIAVVPLRSGGGSRLKILEAMALGRPVVSTRLGREGLDLEDGTEVITADDPNVFANEILALLKDPEKWRNVTEAARKKVEKRYDWDHVCSALLDLYENLLPGDEPPLVKTNAPPRISVIVPVYNSKESLPLCLDALEQSTIQDYELIIVDDHSSDGSDEIARLACDHFVRLDQNSGPSAARNAGARLARSNLLFLLDADVLVEPDTLERVLGVFEDNPGISASFCSYQHDTLPQNFVSQYKNLQHHYTHQVSGREAATFCGGFGAILKDVFFEVGGFDVTCKAMEDVELGYRLHKKGHRILLSPEIQLTHCKNYTLPKLVRSDVFFRAVPWTRIMLQRRIFRGDLNLRGNNMMSMIVVYLMIITPVLPVPVMLTETGLGVLFVLLNRQFLAFLERMRGKLFALTSIPMIWFQYFYSGVGLGLGILAYIKESLFPGEPEPGVKPS